MNNDVGNKEKQMAYYNLNKWDGIVKALEKSGAFDGICCKPEDPIKIKDFKIHLSESHNEILTKQKYEMKQKAKNGKLKKTGVTSEDFQNFTAQVVTFFEVGTNITYVDPSGKEISHYDELPVLPMSLEDSIIVLKKANEIDEQHKTNPNIFNGKHVLVYKAEYDGSTKTVKKYCYQVDYAFLSSYSKLSEELKSRIGGHFRNGVLVPVITKDGFSAVTIRKTGDMNSFEGGFQQPQKNGMLNIRQQGINELEEELLYGQNVQFTPLNNSMAMSTRSTYNAETFDTMEVYTPIELNCNKSELQSMIENPTASDARKEHKGNYIVNLHGTAQGSNLSERFKTPVLYALGLTQLKRKYSLLSEYEAHSFLCNLYGENNTPKIMDIPQMIKNIVKNMSDLKRDLYYISAGDRKETGKSK